MEIKLNDTILDILSKYDFPINDFIYGNKVNLYQVHELLEYNSNQILKSLWDLIRDELIIFNKATKPINSLDDLVSIDFDPSITIGLSCLGGQKWEKAFEPNWLNYIDVLYDDVSYSDPVAIELYSLNKDLLLKVLKPIEAINLERFISIDLEWKPCYWKTFDSSHCFKFAFLADDIKHKIIIDDIYNSLSDYQNLFCPKTHHFY